MGGLKKTKVSTPQAGVEKGKEIRIVTRHVVTVSDVMKNPRAIKLLYVISLAPNGISEKALAHLLYHMEKSSSGGKVGYSFAMVGDTPVSKELLNDLTSLKYTGLVEVSPRNRKLVLTGLGKELLEKMVEQIHSDAEALRKSFEEAWPRVAPVDLEASLRASRH